MNKKSFIGNKADPKVIIRKQDIHVDNSQKIALTKLTFKRLWKDYISDAKWKVFAIIFLSFIAACLQTTGVYFIGRVYDQFFLAPDPASVFAAFMTTITAIFLIFAFNNGFNYLIAIIMLRVSEYNVCYRLRKDLFCKIQRLPVKFFDQNASGELITRSSMDVDNISSAIAFNFVQNIYYQFLILSISILMVMINWALGLIVLLIYPVFTYVAFKFMMFVAPEFGNQQREVGRLNSFVEERVSGVKIVSLFRQEELNKKEFAAINERLTKHSIVANAFANILMPLNTFFNNISFVILTAFGISLIIIGKIQPTWGIVGYQSRAALLIVFTIFSRNLTNPLNQVISSFGQLTLAFVSLQRVFNILDEQEEKEHKGAKDLKTIDGVVEAKHLYFGYDHSKMILKDINFIAKPNEVIALVGPTGAGKTTIVNLITKFYDISKGQLLIDNIPINKIKADSLRRHITVVLQDTVLFNKTIRENIRFGRLDATDEEVEKAAKLANADKFIKHMKNGYETILENNGHNLSQGQRQLLAIARAFLANSKIIILDEASSSIDTKTELDVQNALKTLMKGRTTFMIAHRLSTIRDANKILVINDGKIIESGTHKSLLKQNGFYAKLYNSQFQ